MRAMILGVVLATWLVTGPAKAECTGADEIINWVHAQVPDATFRVHDSPVEVAALSEGITKAAGVPMKPDVYFIVFRSPSKPLVAMVVGIVNGCYDGRIDMPAKIVDLLLEKSKS